MIPSYKSNGLAVCKGSYIYGLPLLLNLVKGLLLIYLLSHDGSILTFKLTSCSFHQADASDQTKEQNCCYNNHSFMHLSMFQQFILIQLSLYIHTIHSSEAA
jgi:hypothetical protein